MRTGFPSSQGRSSGDVIATMCGPNVSFQKKADRFGSPPLPPPIAQNARKLQEIPDTMSGFVDSASTSAFERLRGLPHFVRQSHHDGSDWDVPPPQLAANTKTSGGPLLPDFLSAICPAAGAAVMSWTAAGCVFLR